MKKTLHIELTKSDYEKFRYFLKTEKINYEPSACYNLIHIIVNVDENELEKCNKFLETL